MGISSINSCASVQTQEHERHSPSTRPAAFRASSTEGLNNSLWDGATPDPDVATAKDQLQRAIGDAAWHPDSMIYSHRPVHHVRRAHILDMLQQATQGDSIAIKLQNRRKPGQWVDLRPSLTSTRIFFERLCNTASTFPTNRSRRR